MKKFVKVLLAIVAILVIVMFAIGKKYHFETSTVINAPAEKVWKNMSSMKAFNQWNPFMDFDPNVKVVYSGNSGQVGEKMLFEKPFESDATSDLILIPEGNATKVTWTMDCELDYPMNLMKFFMDGQMEKSYGSGLKKLKGFVEK